jgi:hypothetical protein
MNCSSQEDEIPEKLRDLKNLTVYSANAKPEVTISFQKVADYGTSEEILIGRIQDMAIDSSGRVFIADIQNQSINVFQPDGTFITQLGRGGNGPGEFGIIKSLQILESTLYVFEPDRNRVSLFGLDDLAYNNTTFLAENRGDYGDLDKSFPWVNDLIIRSNHTFLAGFMIHLKPGSIEPWQNADSMIFYYLLDDTGKISSEKQLTVYQTHTLVGGLLADIKVFFGSPMLVISSQNNVYLSDDSEFLIKIFDPEGAYQRALFYPISKIPLTQKSIRDGGIANTNFRTEFLLENLKNMDIPKYWPVINDMKMDDSDRLWVATTVEDMSVYEWWVLDQMGSVLARFNWPRSEPIEEISNSYIYTRKTEEETGAQTIVKYRVEMNESKQRL